MKNRIYNNLNIENLIKTDSFKQLTIEEKEVLLKNSQWFNQFDFCQQQLIRLGLEDNLDVSIYAKKEFDWNKMGQIRAGLIDNLDATIYAKPEYSYGQMMEIRKGLKYNLDVSIYAKPEISGKEMMEIRRKLLKQREKLENEKNI